MNWNRTNHRFLGFALVLAVMLPVYLSTLQTIPNGAEHYYMIDVGETQIVLNTWGTLHATGYPLYVMSGNVLVTILRGLGMSPAVAPGLVSLAWSLVALGLIYTLAVHLTGRAYASAGMTILFGLTRTVWIHASIAEIYSFGLALLALLLLIALWQKPINGRIYWLALAGGLGVFHHRALLMAAPALVYAVWTELTAQPRKLPRMLAVNLFIGLLGFLPYLYLPLRANAGAAWVYGEPGTWDGFWDQFTGREAARFIGAPGSWDALVANFNTVNTVLATDLTAPGIVLGLAGLLIGIRNPKRRWAAMTMLISGGAAYLFHVALYTDVLSALILPIVLSASFGWLFLADALLSIRTTYRLLLWAAVGLGVVGLIVQNLPFIRDLTTNQTGLETIALAEGAPDGSTLMLDWGPRHFAVGFARDVLGELPGVTLVDHKADFRAMVEAGQVLVTPDFTFYNRSVHWWEDQLGTRVYLNAVAPRLVAIRTQPELASEPGGGVNVHEARIECTADAINLYVTWAAGSRPERDWSVFVHLLDAGGTVIGQGDQSAPIYGWRPVTSWETGEMVHDVYPLARDENAVSVRYGLYRQTETGAFENESVYEVPVECGE